MKKLGLALAGGGSKGLIHAGALQYFEENKIVFKSLSGTSAGSIVAGLYCCGKKPYEILNFFSTTKMFTTKHLGLSTKGFIQTSTLRNEFEEIIGDPKIENLNLELKIVATNLLDGTSKIFSKGNLINSILASSAYPGVFTPMKIDNVIYADGGMVNNFPIDIIPKNIDATVGIDFPKFEKQKEKDLNNMFDILTRSFDIIRNINASKKETIADIYLTPSKGINLGTFDTDPHKLEEIFELGYSYTEKYFQNYPEKLSLLKQE